MPGTPKLVLPGSDFPAGLSQPALRALTGAGCYKLKDLTRFTEVEIKNLHGIGPNAMTKLKAAMAEKGLSFAGENKGK